MLVSKLLLIAVPLLLLIGVSSINAISEEFEPETCHITLKDGYIIKVTRWYDIYTNAEGEEVPTHNCEQLQEDYANTTYAEYLEFASRINEAGDKLGKMFLPDD
ncbi:MAG: hypothetical protein ACRD8W_07670 [Nitrososphaeraceae archaeon]